MTTYQTTADQVVVGDTLVDSDHTYWAVKAVELVDQYTEAQALKFTLMGEAGNLDYEWYFADEKVRLSNEDGGQRDLRIGSVECHGTGTSARSFDEYRKWAR